MKIQTALSFLLITCLQGYAQPAAKTQKADRKFQYKVTGGFNVGAMSPIPLPNTIRKVKSYNLLFAPAVNFETNYELNPHWAIAARAGISWKAMKVADEVQYFHTMIQVGQGSQASSFEGAFSGTNYTNANNAYLTFPVFAVFTPKQKWHYKLGGYFAFLVSRKFEGTVSDGYIRNGGSLGERVDITSANFNFKDEQRPLDLGLFGGISRNAGKKWEINAEIQWGLRRVFPESFTGIGFGMYNVFANFGVGYKL